MLWLADDGRVIPAGTDLVLDVVSVHTDPDTYPDPYVYKPERFTEEMKPYTYIPFSLGPRSCIGNSLIVCNNNNINRWFDWLAQ